MDTEGGGETGTSPSQSRYKKGHMTNIHLTDSDEEAIVDFVKEELYDKTNEHFKNKKGLEGMTLGEVCYQQQAVCQVSKTATRPASTCHLLQPPPLSKIIRSSQPSLSLLSSQLTPKQNHYACLQSLLFRTTSVKHLWVLFKTTRIFQKQFISCMFKKFQHNKHYTPPHQTL